MRTRETSCLTARKRSAKFIIAILYSFLAILLSTMSFAQITDPFTQCTNGCTANDVQIKRAYLVQPTSPYNELNSSFQCQTLANVKLALDLTAKTPRIGVYVFARIVNHSDHTIIYTPVGECFPAPLASTGVTKVVFNQPISWPCGTQIDLIDVFIGWGTGNTDFCAGSSDPRCPATPSKCFSLPPGQYISIQIPSATNSSMTQCETTAGGGTSSFDLTSLNGTVSNNASNVTVNWWETNTSGTLSNCIPTSLTTAYISGSKNVYAKVKNNADTTAYSISTVTLAVVSRPTVYTLSGNSICTSPSSTGVLTLSNSQTGVSYQLKLASNSSNVGSSQNGTGSALQWTGITASTNYYVLATGASPTSCTSQTSNASVSLVSNPTALVLTGSSICTSAPNTGTITSGTSGSSSVSYQLYNSLNQTVQSPKSGTGSALQWTGLPAGNGYYVVATGASPTSCTSTSNSVNVASVTNPSAPSVTYNAPACDQTTFSLTVGGLLENDVVTVLDKNGNAIAGLTPASPYTVPASTTSKNFTGIPAGSGYQVTLSRGGCTSAAQSCGTSSGAVTKRESASQEVGVISQPTVKAYPNPFNDHVKFVINSPAAGNGSLEVYNVMGQKVKTVYQGRINAGNQSFELVIPKKQQETLIYMLRIDGKKVTGKLLQLNN